MTSVVTVTTVPTDSPEARRYNRVKRWLGITDFVLGLILLLALLVTGWSGTLRDLAYSGGFQNYTLAVFLYVLMLMGIGKLLGLGLDYYGFRLEHRFQLSNQKLRAWIWDEFKGFLVGVILASIVTELLYFIIREAPQHWWLLAWAAFLGLFVLLAQIAPVVLFPIFYKFEPLEDEELRSRLVRLSERARTRVRGAYKWKLSERSKQANAALTGLGNTRRIILADTLLDSYSPDEIEAVLAHELGHHVHRHIFKSILVQAGITLLGFWAANAVLHYAIDQRHMFETLSDFANLDRKSTRLNSSHSQISYAVFCLKKQNWIAVSNALLSAVTVFVAVLTNLQVTRQIDDLAYDGRGLAFHRLADRRGDRRRAPRPIG